MTLVPMPFMGDIIGASAETDADGMCSVMGDDGKPGAIPGIYRVEITHPEAKISSKYNTESTLSVALEGKSVSRRRYGRIFFAELSDTHWRM